MQESSAAKFGIGENAELVSEILTRGELTSSELAHYLGTSLVSVARWLRGDTHPSKQMQAKLVAALSRLNHGLPVAGSRAAQDEVFASRGVRRRVADLPLFRRSGAVEFDTDQTSPVLQRLFRDGMWGDSRAALAQVLADRAQPAPTPAVPDLEGISAGKNTYTYDAHTYHTKVPPQGIAEVLRRYLPEGGLVLDPFAGSGMTGVAARTLGLDVVLNELSPAASFIADRFTHSIDPATFMDAVDAICSHLAALRTQLYSTSCRECGKDAEILYTVWSYRVSCNYCSHEFVLWDHCRQYGRTVRDHKILGAFPCPQCSRQLRKGQLPRTTAVPVLLGYKCCSRVQIEHPLSDVDHARLQRIASGSYSVSGFTPVNELPDGVNLRQPRRHGLTSVDRFYTPRNLAAMSALWREIHTIVDDELAGFVAFAFTSLYQRVTKLSEFRFWGGSGNTARFNVPFIFNEANVFATFERKAKTIRDHLETSARAYSGRAVVRTGSATDIAFLPDESVDLIFTDPPFGANINYSEMNFLWESWLGAFTNNTKEAIINRSQNKDVARYGELMADSLRECHRVLRNEHWMVLVFMNSSQEVWQVLRDAVVAAGFTICRVDIFDKQHGTFKQFVSENTAGCDLLLHCRKEANARSPATARSVASSPSAVRDFLEKRRGVVPTVPFLHVRRDDEIDFRMLYSEFVAERLSENGSFVDFATFRTIASTILAQP